MGFFFPLPVSILYLNEKNKQLLSVVAQSLSAKLERQNTRVVLETKLHSWNFMISMKLHKYTKHLKQTQHFFPAFTWLLGQRDSSF